MRINNNGLLALAVLLTSALVFGCAEHDDNIQGLQNRGITFAPQMVNDWNTTRGEGYRSMAETTITSQPLAEGLYLQTIVTTDFKGDGQQKAVTRGTLYTNSTFANNETFYVSGYRHTTNTAPGSANFLASAPVTKIDNEWKTSETYYIPYANEEIDFFAWYVPGGSSAVTVANADGGVQLTYTMPTTIGDQPDLLAAVKKNETFNYEDDYKVQLVFGHQLTCVNFVIDDNVAPGTINEIAFTDVYTSGTLTVGDSWDTSNGEAPDVTAFSPNFSTTGTNNYIKPDEGNNRVVLSNLLMVPQNFTNSTQKIRVKLTVEGETEPRTLYANLQGSQWLPGTTVTYKLSTSSINSLRMGTVTYPDSWGDASTENSKIKSQYAVGDAFGVFGVDKNGKVVSVNEKLTLEANGWSDNVLYTPDCTYYFYYPYQEGGLTSAPSLNDNVLQNSALPTAAEFFADAVTAWAPDANQSDSAKLNKQDLQIGCGTLVSASKVNLTMAHKMGLAKVTLGTGKSTASVKYTHASTSSGDTYTLSGQSVFIKATNLVVETTNKPLWNGDAFYYVVNKSNPITFTSVGNRYDSWGESVTVSPEHGEYNTSYTALPYTDRSAYTFQGVFYSYTGGSQSFTVPADGTYTFECWGAQGSNGTDGTNSFPGGYGGYTEGGLLLANNETIYIYVGGHPADKSLIGGWNGGGNGKDSGQTGYAGGGATDVRLISGDWNDFASLKSRIMVAAGGGGSGKGPNETTDVGLGGQGGGLEGYHGVDVGANWGPHCFCGLGGTQTAPGNFSIENDYIQSSQYLTEVRSIRNSKSNQGGFGYGGYDYSTTCGGPGGGAGYYGGGAGNRYHSGGGGGSSFISGHPNCNAISSSSTSGNISHTGSPNHYSKYVFTGTVMIDGKGKQWTGTEAGSTVNVPNTTTDGTQSTGGHVGHGYCRIILPILVQ